MIVEEDMKVVGVSIERVRWSDEVLSMCVNCVLVVGKMSKRDSRV